MSTRLLPLLTLVAWAGATTALSGSRLVRRRPLAARLAPYGPLASPPGAPDGPSGTADRAGGGYLLWAGPAAQLADRLAAVLGTRSPLERRLAQAGSPLDPLRFRSRQAAIAVAAVLLAGTAVASIGLPALPAGVVVAGGGLAAFLWSEQRLIDAVTDRHEQLRLELPVVAEQLGMLLGAGWSLGSAMNRLADRGRGAAAQDLAVVCGRIRHGLSEGAALAEWAERTDLVALHRLVSVLALDRHTSDIGRLIAEEARSMRLESHRALLEVIERRSQAVWIPVTVAALVPGVLFLAVPFVDALRLFTAS